MRCREWSAASRLLYIRAMILRRPRPARLAPGLRARRYVALYGAVPFAIALAAVWWSTRALPAEMIDFVLPGRPARPADLGPVPTAA